VLIKELGWELDVYKDDFPNEEGRYMLMTASGTKFRNAGMAWSGPQRTNKMGWSIGWPIGRGYNFGCPGAEHGWWVWGA
jgi:hypothetical protein